MFRWDPKRSFRENRIALNKFLSQLLQEIEDRNKARRRRKQQMCTMYEEIYKKIDESTRNHLFLNSIENLQEYILQMSLTEDVEVSQDQPMVSIPRFSIDEGVLSLPEAPEPPASVTNPALFPENIFDYILEQFNEMRAEEKKLPVDYISRPWEGQSSMDGSVSFSEFMEKTREEIEAEKRAIGTSSSDLPLSAFLNNSSKRKSGEESRVEAVGKTTEEANESSSSDLPMNFLKYPPKNMKKKNLQLTRKRR